MSIEDSACSGKFGTQGKGIGTRHTGCDIERGIFESLERFLGVEMKEILRPFEAKSLER